MPTIPNLVERLVLFGLNREPGAVLDRFGAGRPSWPTTSASSTNPPAVRSLGELAERVDAQPDGLRPLVEFLATTGYASQPADGYENSATTIRWLAGWRSRPPTLVPLLGGTRLPVLGGQPRVGGQDR